MGAIIQKENSTKAMLSYLIHGTLPGGAGDQNEKKAFRVFTQKLTERRIADKLLLAFNSVSARNRFVCIAENQIDKAVLRLTDTVTPFHTRLVADLLVFHIHVKIRLGVDDGHFYERLLLTLTSCRWKNNQQAFLFFFMKEMAEVSGKEITDIARMLQGSLMLKKDSLKVINQYFWRETFSDPL